MKIFLFNQTKSMMPEKRIEMSHHKHHEKLEKLKEAIISSEKLTEEQKSNALAHIEEWYAEDKAFGTLVEALIEKFAELEPLFSELGLI